MSELRLGFCLLSWSLEEDIVGRGEFRFSA